MSNWRVKFKYQWFITLIRQVIDIISPVLAESARSFRPTTIWNFAAGESTTRLVCHVVVIVVLLSYSFKNFNSLFKKGVQIRSLILAMQIKKSPSSAGVLRFRANRQLVSCIYYSNYFIIPNVPNLMLPNQWIISI